MLRHKQCRKRGPKNVSYCEGCLTRNCRNVVPRRRNYIGKYDNVFVFLKKGRMLSLHLDKNLNTHLKKKNTRQSPAQSVYNSTIDSAGR